MVIFSIVLDNKFAQVSRSKVGRCSKFWNFLILFGLYVETCLIGPNLHGIYFSGRLAANTYRASTTGKNAWSMGN